MRVLFCLGFRRMWHPIKARYLNRGMQSPRSDGHVEDSKTMAPDSIISLVWLGKSRIVVAKVFNHEDLGFTYEK